MEKIRLGIIGVGNMGSSHAKKVNRGDVPDFVPKLGKTLGTSKKPL